MRITTADAAEFIEALEDVESVFDSALRVSVVRRPDHGGRNAVKFDIVFQASTVVLLPDGSEYLLECGEMCGTDYNDSTQDMEGSTTAAALKLTVTEFAARKGWRVLPGMISE